jgi:hypothetical protein
VNTAHPCARREPAAPASEEQSGSPFRHWVAIGVLAACWIAEATMCAARGF